MTTTNDTDIYTVQATADLSAQASRYRAVTIFGTITPASLAAGALGGSIGVLLNAPRSGEWASYAYDGITKVFAGAAISTPGWPIMVGSNGYFFAANSGFSHIGRLSDQAAASGDLVQAFVGFEKISLWSGAA